MRASPKAPTVAGSSQKKATGAAAWRTPTTTPHVIGVRRLERTRSTGVATVLVMMNSLLEAVAVWGLRSGPARAWCAVGPRAGSGAGPGQALGLRGDRGREQAERAAHCARQSRDVGVVDAAPG